VTTTTGYHPLWFALDVGLVWIFRLNRSAYLRAFVATSAMLALVHGALLRRLFGQLSPSRLLADLVTIFVVVRSIDFSFDENGIRRSSCRCSHGAHSRPSSNSSCPAQCAPARRAWIPRRGDRPGRIDAILFGLGCGALLLLHHHKNLGATLRHVIAFCVGLTPFALYLGCNWSFSGICSRRVRAQRPLRPVSRSMHIYLVI